jgi:hypothetical protein
VRKGGYEEEIAIDRSGLGSRELGMEMSDGSEKTRIRELVRL